MSRPATLAEGTHGEDGPVARLRALGEILPFTALRGIAAWWVVFYHFREYVPAGDTVRLVLSRGALAVDLFFIMSGFVMALSYGPGFRTRITPRTYWRFIALRLGRIYPVHLLTLCLFVSVPVALSLTGRPPVQSQFEPGYFVQSLFLVQASGFGQGLAWNLPAWSISTEMMFYLICPIVLLGWERGLVGVVPHVVLAACALVLIGFVGILADGLTSSIDRFGVFRCILECTLGVLLYRLSGLVGTPAWLAAVLLSAAAACVWAYAAGWAPDYAVIPLGFTCLLWSLLNPRQWLGLALSNPVLLWIGRLSYATYMMHFLVKYWVKFLLLDQMPLWAFCAAYAGCVLLASIAMHYAVELPSRRMGRALVKRWFDDAAPRSRATAPLPLSGGLKD